jgi:hypothetical protein
MVCCNTREERSAVQHSLYTAACRYVCMYSPVDVPSYELLLTLHPHSCNFSREERRADSRPSFPALPLHYAPPFRSMCSPHASVTYQTGPDSGSSIRRPPYQLIVGLTHNMASNAPRQRLFLKPQSPHLVIANLFPLASSVVLLIIPPVVSTSLDGRIDAMDRVHSLPVSHISAK